MAFGFPGIRPQDLEKLMKKLGISMENVEATRVVVEVADGSILVFESPGVTVILKHKDSAPILYVMGNYRVEKKTEHREEALFTDEDVKLVAEQAGVSLEDARRALEETRGDIALAILKLTQQRGSSS